MQDKEYEQFVVPGVYPQRRCHSENKVKLWWRYIRSA